MTYKKRRKPVRARNKFKRTKRKKFTIKHHKLHSKSYRRRRLRRLSRKNVRLIKRKPSPIPVFEPSKAIQVPQLQLPQISHYHAELDTAELKRLSILYVIHQFYPDTYAGTEKFVLNLARTMLSKGHRVKVVTSSNRGLEDYPNSLGEVVYQDYDYGGVPVLAFRHKQKNPAYAFDIGDPDLAAFAKHVITNEQPDIIHIGHPMRGMDFMQACLSLNMPYIITLTDFWFICPRSIMLQSNLNLCAGPEQGNACATHCQIPNAQQRYNIHSSLLQSAQKVLSPSTFLGSMMKNSLPDLNVEVVQHGMRYETISRNEKVYQAGDPLTLMYGGTLNHHKGVHLIVEAMSIISTDRLRLKIYGSGPAPYVEKLKQASARDGRIELCGEYTENDIHHIYQDADIAVIPSIWYENYPLALHEAIASHVPAIVSDLGGMSEKVNHDVNGFTFRTGDTRHLAERIKVLLDHPTILNTFKSNLNEIQIPSIQQEADSYERIYYESFTTNGTVNT